MFNKDFYPTPLHLISRMISKVKGRPNTVLEPSAGKGDIIDAITSRYNWEVSAIEIDPELQATLRGKGIKVIDADFLSYAAPDKFDLIIANPPFDEGDKHLLKAINIIYRGEIVFLLNAETLRNPCTITRRKLGKKLSELNAEIEFIGKAFSSAERKTDVEVALVYIKIERKIEDDLFSGVNDTAETINPEIEQNFEVSTGRTIEELVAGYNQTVQVGTETILGYYKNYRKIGSYLRLNEDPNSYSSARGDRGDMTAKMQSQLNAMLKAMRVNYWRKVLNIREVEKRLTDQKRNQFELQIKKQSYMDFTESNIRQFILNLIGGFEQTLTDAIVDIFHQLTAKHSFSNGPHEENVHYYNGWRTNKAWKCNKKVILPFYGGAFFDWGKWKLAWRVEQELQDIDIVMNYFDGMPHYTSMIEALKKAFERQDSKNIKSTYFTLTVHKKGTLHMTFNSDDILRRFNVSACKGNGWLPPGYGAKPYQDMEEAEKVVVDSFEGEQAYANHLNSPLLAVAAASQALLIAG